MKLGGIKRKKGRGRGISSLTSSPVLGVRDGNGCVAGKMPELAKVGRLSNLEDEIEKQMCIGSPFKEPQERFTGRK